MATEYAYTLEVDEKSDIYSFGLVLPGADNGVESSG